MPAHLHRTKKWNRTTARKNAWGIFFVALLKFFGRTAEAEGLRQALFDLIRLINKGEQAEPIGNLLERMALAREFSLSSAATHIRSSALFRHAEALARRNPLKPSEAAGELKSLQRRYRIAQDEYHHWSRVAHVDANYMAELTEELNLLHHMEDLALIRDVVAKTSHTDPKVAQALRFKEKTALERALQTASETERAEILRRIEIMCELSADAFLLYLPENEASVYEATVAATQHPTVLKSDPPSIDFFRKVSILRVCVLLEKF